MRGVLIFVVGLAGLALAACAPPAPMKSYDFPALGFSAAFPDQPTVTYAPAAADSGHQVSVGAEGGGRDFAVSIADADPSRDIDDLTDAAAAAMAKGIGGEASDKAYCATPEGLLGRELILSRHGEPFADVRLYKVDARFYIMVAKSVFGPKDSEVQDFLTSFHALKAGGGAATNAP
jgi:hypothetical protein